MHVVSLLCFLVAAASPSSNVPNRRFDSLYSLWKSNTNMVNWTIPTVYYSIVADGTQCQTYGASNLRAYMASTAAANTWESIIADAATSWSSLSGVNVVVTTDDGAAVTSTNRGKGENATNNRGDIRICGAKVTSDTALGRTAFPNDGDMVLNTATDLLGGGTVGFQFFQNVISHELGHSLGLCHVCPDGAYIFLMEPTLSVSNPFIGPQHDDIRGIQRLYGDAAEPDNTPSTAHAVNNGAEVAGISLHTSTDVDYYLLAATAGTHYTISAVPTGQVYSSGAAACNASCSGVSTPTINSARMAQLRLQLVDPITGADSGSNTATALGESATVTITASVSANMLIAISSPSFQDVQTYSLCVNAASCGGGDVPTIVSGACTRVPTQTFANNSATSLQCANTQPDKTCDVICLTGFRASGQFHCSANGRTFDFVPTCNPYYTREASDRSAWMTLAIITLALMGIILIIALAGAVLGLFLNLLK